MSEIAFKEKPSDELIKMYEQKIEDLLSPLGVKVKMILRDHPSEWWSRFNEKEEIRRMKWMDGVLISNDDVKELRVPLYGKYSVTENDTHSEIWHDAYEIQNALYVYLNKLTGRPSDGDPYWKLWDRLSS